MFDDIGSGDMTGSLLMALYADPEAKAPGVDPKYAPKDGYASARARLAAAHEANRLTKRLHGHERPVYSAAFSPDGKFIVTGSNDHTAGIWDATTGQPLRTLQGHESWVNSAAFSPDGKFIVTGSVDNTARIWDAETGQPLRTLQGHEGGVASAAFSPDGKFIVTGSRDSTARIWAVPEILLADAPTQVTMACKMLADARAPLAFSIADIARYPVLQGVAEDPANPGFLVSPCRGVLPDEAFARDP
jgi:predicted NACHT family NTPase